MKVQPINFIPQFKRNSNSSKNENQVHSKHVSYISSPINAHRNYLINFTARKGEDFVRFNEETMPSTLSNYYAKDFEARKTVEPLKAMNETFELLGAADNIQEVKEAFPDEPLFKDLKTLDELNPRRGYLYQCKYYQQGIKDCPPILKTGEDLTLYLLKKIYLECKTLKEINLDLNKDVSDYHKDYVNKKGENDKINYSTLSALGIGFPDLAFWNSLQAAKRNPELAKKQSGGVYVERSKPKNPDAPKKHSDGRNHFSKLSPEKQQEILDAMREGRANSTYFEYPSEIMTLSADKVDLSGNLIKYFKERHLDEDFLKMDFSSLNDKQQKIMKEFWKSNNKLKIEFSKAIKETLKDFESAISWKDSEPEFLDSLLNDAKAIKDFHAQESEKRRLERISQQEAKKPEVQISKPFIPEAVSPKPKTKLSRKELELQERQEINNEYNSMVRFSLKPLPRELRQRLTKFIINDSRINFDNKKYILKMNEEAQGLLLMSEDEKTRFERKIKNVNKMYDVINEDFNKQNTTLVDVSEAAILKVLYEKLHDTSVFSLSRAEILSPENREYFNDEPSQKIIEEYMKETSRPISDKNVQKIIKNVMEPELLEISHRSNLFDRGADRLLMKYFAKAIINDPDLKNAFDKSITSVIKKLPGTSNLILHQENELIKRTLAQKIFYTYMKENDQSILHIIDYKYPEFYHELYEMSLNKDSE